MMQRAKTLRVQVGAAFQACACGKGEEGLSKGRSVKSGGELQNYDRQRGRVLLKKTRKPRSDALHSPKSPRVLMVS
jgi:hypothetical protein